MSGAGRALPGLALAWALGACAPEPVAGPAPAEPQAATAPPPGEVVVTGEVEVGGPGGAPRGVAGADVLFLTEEAARPFLAARLSEASAGLEALRQERARLRAEHASRLAEADRTNQAWKRTNDNDLTRRLEVQRRPRGGAEGVRAVHRRLLEEKQAAWASARGAAARSDEAERALRSLEARARRYREGPFFLQGLPPAARAARTGPDGAFAVSLEPGRYAVVASGERRQGASSESVIWLLWARVEPGKAQRLQLDGSNLHGTDCAECGVRLRGLPE